MEDSKGLLAEEGKEGNNEESKRKEGSEGFNLLMSVSFLQMVAVVAL